MAAKIKEDYQGRKNPQTSLLHRPMSFETKPFGVMTKYHPFSSRAEYEYRKNNFTRAQRRLFDELEPIQKALAENGDDLTKTVVYGRYGYLDGITQLLKRNIVAQIFGDLFDERCENQYYICRISQEEENRWLLKEKLFQPYQLFHFVGEIVDQKNAIIRESTLNTDALNQTERELCAKKAYDLHETLSFSKIFYTRLRDTNPMADFLRDIAEIGIKLVPDSIDDGVYDCTVDCFLRNPTYKKGGNLRVYERNDSKPIILENCVEIVHSKMVKRGDLVKCVIASEEEESYLGSLIWIPNLAKNSVIHQ
jgi:hypothetical protein